MFFIAEFSGVGQAKEIAVVHLNWMCGNTKCYWPPFWKQSSQLIKSLRKGEPPNPQTWLVFDVRIIGKTRFETYDDARRALNDAQVTSDLSSAENPGGLRKRPVVEDVCSSDSDVENDPLSMTPKTRNTRPRTRKLKQKDSIELPPPPGIPKFLDSSSLPTPRLVAVNSDTPILSSNNDMPINAGSSGALINRSTVDTASTVMRSPFSAVRDGNDGTQYITVEQDNGSDVNANEIEIKSAFIANAGVSPFSFTGAGGSMQSSSFTFASQSLGTAENRVANASQCSSSGVQNSQHFINQQFPTASSHHASNYQNNPQIDGLINVPELTDVLKSIQTTQQLLMAKQDMLVDMVTTLLGGRRAAVSRNIDGEKSGLSLPFSELTAFREYEDRMRQDKSLRETLITILETTGGNTPNQTVHRVMSELMTNELMHQYTFKGNTGKDAFINTLYFTCVFDAVKRQPKGQTMSKKEVELAIDYWLRKASTRLGIISSKSKKIRVESATHNANEEDEED